VGSGHIWLFIQFQINVHVYSQWCSSDNKLFMQKRKEQMYAAHNVWEMEDYSKRYSMAKALLEALFPVCENCVGLVWCGVLCVCHQSVSL